MTGGAGQVGGKLVPRLAARGHQVKVMTHSGRRVVGAESVPGDLATGEGLQMAIVGSDVIVHLATDPEGDPMKVDLEGTKKLIDLARQGGIKHLVYLSIVGVDRASSFKYYRAKLEAEQAIEQGGVAFSILRATQFHNLVDARLRRFARYPAFLLPRGLQFQPVDAGEIANAVLALATDAPRGRVPDFGGPEVLDIAQLLDIWRGANNVGSRPVIWVPVPGKTVQAIRAGALICPQNRQGRITFREWLAGARG